MSRPKIPAPGYQQALDSATAHTLLAGWSQEVSPSATGSLGQSSHEWEGQEGPSDVCISDSN